MHEQFHGSPNAFRIPGDRATHSRIASGTENAQRLWRATSEMGQKLPNRGIARNVCSWEIAEVNQGKADIRAGISVVEGRAEVDPGRRDFSF